MLYLNGFELWRHFNSIALIFYSSVTIALKGMFLIERHTADRSYLVFAQLRLEFFYEIKT